MKRIKRIVLASILLVVVLVLAGILWIDQIAKTGIEKGSTYALGVDTKLDGIDIGVLSGRTELSGLIVANPKGFESGHFVSLGNGVLSVSLGSLAKETVEISEFSLAGVDMNLERVEGNSNYGVIMANLQRFESGDTETEEEGGGKKFVIREILIRDVTVHVDLLPVGGKAVRTTVPIKEIRLENVGTGSDQGIQVAQLSATLIKAIVMAAVEQGGDLIPKEISGELTSALKGLEPLGEVGAQLANEAGQAIQQIGEQLGGLTGPATEAGTSKTGDTEEDASTKLIKGVGDLLKPEKKEP